MQLLTSDEASRLVTKVEMECFTLTFEEAVARLDSLETEVISRLSDTSLTAAFQRAIAQERFRHTMWRDCPIEICERYYLLRDALGYVHVLDKTHNMFLLARMCILLRLDEKAMEWLDGILEQLRANDTPDEFVAKEIDEIQRFRQRFVEGRVSRQW